MTEGPGLRAAAGRCPRPGCCAAGAAGALPRCRRTAVLSSFNARRCRAFGEQPRAAPASGVRLPAQGK